MRKREYADLFTFMFDISALQFKSLEVLRFFYFKVNFIPVMTKLNFQNFYIYTQTHTHFK